MERQVELAWGAVYQSRSQLNTGVKILSRPGEDLRVGVFDRWPTGLYADAMLRGLLGTRGGAVGSVQVSFSRTMHGRRANHVEASQVATALKALQPSFAEVAPLAWDSFASGRGVAGQHHSAALRRGSLELSYAQALRQGLDPHYWSTGPHAHVYEVHQLAGLWAEVGVGLPKEAALMAASMIPTVGEQLDADVLLDKDAGWFAKSTAGVSLGLSLHTLGVTPNVGRGARWIERTAGRIGDLFGAGGRALARGGEHVAAAGNGIVRGASEAAAQAAAFGKGFRRGFDNGLDAVGHLHAVPPPGPITGGLTEGLKDALELRKVRAAESAELPKILNITERNLQKGFQRHGADFGLTGNWSKARAAEFREAVHRHINTPGIREINGSYRGQSGFTHHLNPNTGVNVVVDSAGNYVTGYKLGANQLNDVLTTGHLW